MPDSYKVPVRDTVGAALRFVADNLRFIGVAALMGAGAVAVTSGLGLMVPLIGMLTGILTGVIQAFVYAALLGAVLYGAGAVRGRLQSDGWRVWGAMVVVGFFLFIVMFVLTIPVFIILFAGPLGPYVGDLERANGDQAAVMEIMLRFAEANPLPLLLTTLFFAAVWLLLTSRLYLAAPASLDQGRVLTFETWNWTKGSMLRITGARLLLLLPANVLTGALGYLVGRVLGFDTMTGGPAMAAAAVGNPALFAVYVFFSTLISLGLYSALEAGLSAHFYRILKPAQTPPAA